jgi:hypothetical protein
MLQTSGLFKQRRPCLQKQVIQLAVVLTDVALEPMRGLLHSHVRQHARVHTFKLKCPPRMCGASHRRIALMASAGSITVTAAELVASLRAAAGCVQSRYATDVEPLRQLVQQLQHIANNSNKVMVCMLLPPMAHACSSQSRFVVTSTPHRHPITAQPTATDLTPFLDDIAAALEPTEDGAFLHEYLGAHVHLVNSHFPHTCFLTPAL